MSIMLHTDALGSVIGAALIFVFTLYSLFYTTTRHSSALSVDFYLLQISLFIFLTGHAVYVSSVRAETVLLWTRIFYSGVCLTLGAVFRFYESLAERKHGTASAILSGLSLLLTAVMFLPGQFLFTEVLNPDKSHSSVIKGPLFPFFIISVILLFLLMVIGGTTWLWDRRDSCFKPIIYGMVIFLINALLNAVLSSWLNLIRPHYWLGTTVMAFSLLFHFTCMVRQNYRELENLRSEREKVYHNLIHDRLTGLYTRGYLYESIHQISSQIQRNSHECSLLFIDVDNFKKLNDDRGHMAGDKLLKQLGEKLTQKTRNYDIPARIGGDEFVLLLPDSTPSAAEKVAKHIRKMFLDLVGETLGDWKHRDSLSLSIGIVSREDWSGSPEQLVSLADKAMYQSKRAGKDRISHYGGRNP